MELIKALWTQEKITYHGRFYQLDDETMQPKPVQQPHLPLWMGVGHPNAVRRTAELADGWMGSGGSSIAEFQASVPILQAGAGGAPAATRRNSRSRSASSWPSTKTPAVARRELNRWFTEVYHNPPGTDASGIHGTPEQVRARLEEVVAMGANHLMLNPVSNYRRAARGAGGSHGAEMSAGPRASRPHAAGTAAVQRIGDAPKRREDQRFITGGGRYLDDMKFDGLAHAVLLRSPHAHARIERIDTSAARRCPACSRC